MSESELIGKSLGQYQILELLGRGGMALVYRAQQISMKRDVAMKVIEPDKINSEEFMKRFERETRAAAMLSHAHILKVFDYGKQDGYVYLVMELINGGSLADLLDKGPVPPKIVSRYLDQIAAAIDFAHGKGVIHRDLKPQNVLIDETNNCYITDFGIVKLLNETSQLTQKGSVVGTPAYIAPEQWQGQPIDARADIYALGVMVFELLTGRLPFQADTLYSMMKQHVNQPPPPPNSIRADLPAALSAVLETALAKNPERRYATATQFATEFAAAISAEASQAKIDDSDTFRMNKMNKMPSAAPQPAAPSGPVPTSAAPSAPAQEDVSTERMRPPRPPTPDFAAVPVKQEMVDNFANRPAKPQPQPQPIVQSPLPPSAAEDAGKTQMYFTGGTPPSQAPAYFGPSRPAQPPSGGNPPPTAPQAAAPNRLPFIIVGVIIVVLAVVLIALLATSGQSGPNATQVAQTQVAMAAGTQTQVALTPSATLTYTPVLFVVIDSPTPVRTPTPTGVLPTNTPIVTATNTPSPTSTPPPTLSQTPTPSATPTITPSPTLSATPTASVTITSSPSITPTETPKVSATPDPVAESNRLAAVAVRAFGPDIGELTTDDTPNPILKGPQEKTFTDFVVDVKFTNPASTPWNYGLFFRSETGGEQYRLILSEKFGVVLIFRTGGNPSVVKRISDAKFEKAAGASNTLRLVVRGPIAYLLINGTYIDTFDVSKRQSGGAVLVASGILPDDKVAGATVRYEGFTISELK